MSCGATVPIPGDSSFRTLTTSCAPLRGGLILVRTLWFALLLAASLALVSCGDDDDDAGDTVLTTGSTGSTTTVSTADPTTTEQRPSTTDGSSTPHEAAATTLAKPTGEPIKLMVIHEVDAGAANPEIAEGAEAAAQAINAGGGIGGRSVEDHELRHARNDPNGAADCGRQAVDEGVTRWSARSRRLMASSCRSSSRTRSRPSASSRSRRRASRRPRCSPCTAARRRTSPASPRPSPRPVRRPSRSPGSISTPQRRSASSPTWAWPATGSRSSTTCRSRSGRRTWPPYAAAALADGVDGVIVGVTAQDAINLDPSPPPGEPDVKIAMIATDVGDVIDALGDRGGRAAPVGGSVGRARHGGRPAVPRRHGGRRVRRPDGVPHQRLGLGAARGRGRGRPRSDHRSRLFDAFNAATEIGTGVSAPLQWKQAPVPTLPRVFNWCMLTLEIEGGDDVPTTGTFIDVVTGELTARAPSEPPVRDGQAEPLPRWRRCASPSSDSGPAPSTA